MASPDCSRRQPAQLLFLAAEGQDRVHHQRALHADEAAQSGVGPFQLLHDQPVLHVAHAGAAVAFQIRAEESQPAHFRDQLAGEAGVAEAIAHQRQGPLVHELARGLAHQ